MLRPVAAILVVVVLLGGASLAWARAGPPVAVLTVEEIYSSVPPTYLPVPETSGNRTAPLAAHPGGATINVPGWRLAHGARAVVNHQVLGGSTVIFDDLWQGRPSGRVSASTETAAPFPSWRLWPYQFEITNIDRQGTVSFRWGPQQAAVAPGQTWSVTMKLTGDKLTPFDTEPAAESDVASALLRGTPLVRLIVRYDGWFGRQAIKVTGY